MIVVAATPFGALLELFVAVPLAIAAGIGGAECALTLVRRSRRPKRP